MALPPTVKTVGLRATTTMSEGTSTRFALHIQLLESPWTLDAPTYDGARQ